MDDLNSEWQRKGATLSDKTARKEFDLMQDEIIRAIRAGKLHYREGSIFGNPWLRLLRREVESLVKSKRGGTYLKDGPQGSKGQSGADAYQPRTETVEDPGGGAGRAENKAEC